MFDTTDKRDKRILDFLLPANERCFESEKLFKEVLKIALDFWSGKLREKKVLIYKTPEELIEIIDAPFPQEPITKSEMLKLLSDVVAKYSIAQMDDRYIAFPDAGNSIPGLAADILNPFINQNLIGFDRSAPIGTLIEIQLIEWLREAIGYPSVPLREIKSVARVGGMWTSGGNLSNYVSILVALFHHFPEIQQVGIGGLSERPAIVLSEGIEHYSYRAAAKYLGIGENNIIWTKSSDAFTTDTESLKKALSDPPPGLKPFYVVGVSGNCRTSGLDDLDGIADLCERYGAWYHVDACHGGSLLFSDKQREKVHGIDRADSVAIDPHKGFMVSYPSSYVLFKDPKALSPMTRYPQTIMESGIWDLGFITPFFGSRGFESLKLWLLIKTLGKNGLGRTIEHRLELSDYWDDLLRKSNLFLPLHKADFYRSAFVFFPSATRSLFFRLQQEKDKEASAIEIMNKYTKLIAKNTYKEGDVCVDLFSIKDIGNIIGSGSDVKFSVMGTSFGNPNLTRETLTNNFEVLSNASKKFVSAMKAELDRLFEEGVFDLGETDNAMGGPAGWE